MSTKEQIKPTPLPWVVFKTHDSQYGIDSKSSNQSVILFCDGFVTEFGNAKTNAELICTAVNSHQSNLDRIKELEGALEVVRDTAIAMKGSLRALPPTGGSVLLNEAPERLRALAVSALAKPAANKE